MFHTEVENPPFVRNLRRSPQNAISSIALEVNVIIVLPLENIFSIYKGEILHKCQL
jgi:hypothetical protein